MRTGSRIRAHRILLAVTALLVAGFLGSTSASAEGGAGGPATSLSGSLSGSLAQSLASAGEGVRSTFAGLVQRDEQGRLPTHVRALGATGAVCGTATVHPIYEDGPGAYRVDVAGDVSRNGCPSEGASVAFRLMYGPIDTGRFGIPSQEARFASGERSIVSLTPAPASQDLDWLGLDALPSSRAAGEWAALTWVGAEGADVRAALEALGVSVARASHYDAALGRWIAYVPGGASFLQSYTQLSYGDVVWLRVK